MFKNEADFKKVVRRLNVDTEPNQAHRENLRRQMLSAYNKSEQKSHKQTTPLGVLRRTIVRNPITKMATAAILIVAVCIGMHYLGGSIDVASVAWSQVVEQISNHTKYKCRQRVVREEGPEFPTMQVYHLNLQQRRQEVEDGSIHIIDMRADDAIPKQQLALESPSGVKLYTHPNGSIYAQCFLESLAEASGEFFNVEDVSEERFTRMIVMPDATIMGLAANRKMSDERLQELVESLAEIEAN